MKNYAISSTAELGQVVQEASAAGATLVPRGGGTQDYRLLAPRPDSWLVLMSGLDQVIDYPFRDMTITVQAGITVARLKAILAEHGQCLPLDVPFPDQATVGGSIAANINGARRFGWGGWRDYVIGISFINDRGEEVKAGGRVVKNVAGYDLCKLMTGSFGSLGIITQATLKVRPLPEKLAVAPVAVRPVNLKQVLLNLGASRLRPVFQIYAHGAEESVLWLGLEDSAAAVDWQLQHLRERLQGYPVTLQPVRLQAEGEAVIQQLTQYCETPPDPWFQMAVLPSRLPNLIEYAFHHKFLFQADLGLGLLVGRWNKDWLDGMQGLPRQDAESGDENSQRGSFERLLKHVRHANGRTSCFRASTRLQDYCSYFNPAQSDAWMMQRVKDALDPKGVFQSGRFPLPDHSVEATRGPGAAVS